MPGGDQLSNHYPEIDGHKLTDFIHELPFYLGNIMKYAWRAPYKGGIEDTVKLLEYLSMSSMSWQKYELSSDAVEYLTKISSRNFYSHHEGLERAHRRCISSAAELILNSDELPSLSYNDGKALDLSVGMLHIELLHN